MTNRLFIALEIPDFALDKVISIRDSVYESNRPVFWEPKNKLHVTLKFLGDTDTSHIESIISIMEDISKKYSLIEAEFYKFGLFYRNRQPVILWLGIKKNLALQELFLELDNRISLLGFRKDDREFTPHLTIVRLKGREDLKKIYKFIKCPDLALKFNFCKFTLFQSILKPTGSEYEEIKSFLLK